MTINEPLLTRGEAISLIKEELGIPVSARKINRAGLDALPPKARYGSSYLYERETVLAWAQTLAKPVEISRAA